VLIVSAAYSKQRAVTSATAAMVTAVMAAAVMAIGGDGEER
jgi:hypothetical protein